MKKRLLTAPGVLLATPLYAAGKLALFKPESVISESYWRTLITLFAAVGIAGITCWYRRVPKRASPCCRVLEKITLSHQSTLFRIEWAGREYLLADNHEALAWLPSAGDSTHAQ
ncbi:hypothetical protein Lgee_1297 [Legionella geestiana]|uniref:Uncharacterized protein n=1 Tax=Legionella geestiana TaxID=45065 RepID=A0A0W0TTR1_9GAMM|nr:hypothetical protein [Legionella geestiana]KTC99031.1 hypothetical protein Lgee_1297 [Legionella geestiana]QBS12637.1 hypothetical protein E4T54_07715 [Legionella geestiana]STX54903.1 Uncharacterised protein [Legionella geestiana]